MAEDTKIQWCDHTASPWHGCAKVAAGCQNCYAEAMSVRNPGTLGTWGANGTRVKSKSFCAKLRKWNEQAKVAGKPVTVFPSICDPFEDRPELIPWRQEMFAVADECPWITLLLLTKRPENIRRMWPRPINPHNYGSHAQLVRKSVIDRYRFATGIRDHSALALVRPNVWLGTSISTQADADKNIPELLKWRDLSPVLFVSAEPLVGAVQFKGPGCDGCYGRGENPATGKPCHFCFEIDWTIIGGESGPHARPCRPEWIRSLVAQCRAASVPYFVKQMGSNVITRNDQIEDAFNDGESGWPDPDIEHDINGFRENYQGADCRIKLRDSKGGDWLEWPDDLRVREFPKAEAAHV